MSSKSVIVIGAGLAGLSSAVALADAGFRVKLLEQRPFLGGRASSYSLPDGEQIDNCQHVTLGCCTNLDDFYGRVGALREDRPLRAPRFRGLRPAAARSWKLRRCRRRLHLAPSLALLSLAQLGGTARHRRSDAGDCAARRAQRRCGDACGCSMLDWLRAHEQSDAAIAQVLGRCPGQRAERGTCAHRGALRPGRFLEGLSLRPFRIHRRNSARSAGRALRRMPRGHRAAGRGSALPGAGARLARAGWANRGVRIGRRAAGQRGFLHSGRAA